MTLLLGFCSFCIGAVIGATGVGGVLLIPALMYMGGLGTHQAMATALFSFLFTGILATWSFQRHGSINWAVTLPVCIGSLISGCAGAFAGARVSAPSLNLLLAAVIVGSSLYSMFPSSKTTIAARLGRRGNRNLLLGVGVFTGFLCGMTGAGGGIVSLPLMLLLGFAPLVSIATGQVLQSIVALSGSVGNYANGFIDFSVVWPVAACELAGLAVGVRIAHIVPVGHLKRAASSICLAIGIFIAARSL